jgi:dienelactone hydrolase
MRFKSFLSFAVCATLMSSVAFAQQTAKITPSNIAYLQYLPQGYSSNTDLYPVVISLHGIKEKGTTSTNPTDLLSSVQRVANVGLPKYVKYGKQYPFILISPQLKTSYGNWPAAYVMDVVNHVRRTLRVDPKRIYITGLSLGGFGVWTTIGAYPEVFAGAVPICAGGNALSKACAIAAQNLPVWGFHGDKDYIVSYTVTTKMVNAINACTPKPSPLAKATLFPGMGHLIWDKVYNETTALSWMLGFTNGTTTSVGNAPPTVDAGNDVIAYLPTNFATCNGTASDSDGSVASYLWTQVSGPSTATLENKYTRSLKASNLKAGTYTFRLKATDDKGAYANDDVKVIINSTTTTTTSSAPLVSAGSDRTLLLPSNYTYIYGKASDSDGIASYLWTKLSGPSANVVGATESRIRVSNLVAGTYVFRLTVKDTKGYSSSDDMVLYVKSSTTASTSTSTSGNDSPIAYAGADKNLYLPSNTIRLYGSAKDTDGKVISYKWTQYSGPSRTAISYSNYASCTVHYLKQGNYTFRLTVKDNDGAVDTDDVMVKVLDGTVSVVPVNPSLERTGSVEG